MARRGAHVSEGVDAEMRRVKRLWHESEHRLLLVQSELRTTQVTQRSDGGRSWMARLKPLGSRALTTRYGFMAASATVVLLFFTDFDFSIVQMLSSFCMLFAFLLLTNAPAAVYLSLVHQRAPIDLMAELRAEAAAGRLAHVDV